MAGAAPRWATYADLEAVPDHLVAEIVDGRLETHAHTLPRLGAALAALAGELGSPFSRGRGGPGDWVFMPRTEFHFERQVLVPDYAGWRRGRLSVDPDAAFIETPPDWVCEILSPATVWLDRGPKRRIYAEAGVSHLWLLDPTNGVLEGFALTGDHWLLLGTVERGGDVALPPFDAAPFPLDDLFPIEAVPPDDPAAPPPAET